YHSFVEFQGNISERGLIVDDIDSDGCNELAVATISGELNIFKVCNCSRHDLGPWKEYKGLGSIVCLLYGDILNIDDPRLIALTAEGMLHIFEISEHSHLTPTLSLTIPENPVEAIIVDYDNDGKKELIIAFQNRRLRIFEILDNTIKLKYPF